MSSGDTDGPSRMVAVVDIDGVLADVRHRLKHVTGHSSDWGRFFAAAPRDGLLEQGAHTAVKLAEVYDIVYLSGRPERCRNDTVDWLERHALPDGTLLLRPNDDHRPARLFKVGALRKISRDATVVVLVDDDPLVLEAAREAGYDVLPATWMGDQPELHRAQEDGSA